MVDIPSTCHICRLTLVSSPHLARSYHHLFPVKPFEEMSVQALLDTRVIYTGSYFTENVIEMSSSQIQ